VSIFRCAGARVGASERLVCNLFLLTLEGIMEVIYCDDTNLAGAIDVIDLDSMAQHIYFGPQAEIMEKVNQFNQRNGCNLSVTKTFRWSPGTYDKVAEMMMERVGLRRRASGMYNYLSREEYYWNQGRQNIQADLRDMDSIISQLRYDGAVWMSDPSVLVERKETFKNYVCEKFDQFLELTSKMDKITILNVLLEDNFSASINSLKLTINICLHPGEIQIYNAHEGDCSNGAPTHIQNLPVDMDILIKIEMFPLREMMTEHNSRFNINTYGQVGEYDDRGLLRFPYVSNAARRWNQPDGWGNICYGDDSTDINNALNRFELPAYAMLLVNWMSRYTQNTNPYNNIKLLYHGEPKWLTDDYRAIFGTNMWDDCSYRPSGEEDYCDTNECALRHTCEIYKAAYPEPVSPEQAEQMTLQWATRMGGVGANAGVNVPSIDPMSVPIQGDREQDHADQTWVNPEALREELEERINAEMDAEEALEEARRHIDEINQETEE